MFALFILSFFMMIFMTVNAIWLILDEWKAIRLLDKEYYEESWEIIMFACLSIIILWVFYLYGIIKWFV
jgi:hypothetical protein